MGVAQRSTDKLKNNISPRLTLQNIKMKIYEKNIHY